MHPGIVAGVNNAVLTATSASLWPPALNRAGPGGFEPRRHWDRGVQQACGVGRDQVPLVNGLRRRHVPRATLESPFPRAVATDEK